VFSGALDEKGVGNRVDEPARPAGNNIDLTRVDSQPRPSGGMGLTSCIMSTGCIATN